MAKLAGEEEREVGVLRRHLFSLGIGMIVAASLAIVIRSGGKGKCSQIVDSGGGGTRTGRGSESVGLNNESIYGNGSDSTELNSQEQISLSKRNWSQFVADFPPF